MSESFQVFGRKISTGVSQLNSTFPRSKIFVQSWIFLERIKTFFSSGPFSKELLDFGGNFSARLSKQNSTHREENFEEIDLFRSFCSLKNLSGHWAKTLRTLGKNFRTGFSKVHIYVSGRPSWAKPTCSEIFFLYK